MANIFVNLPIPATDGVGAAVDVSTLGVEKTIVVGSTPGPSGEPFRCTINIEMSNAAAAPAADNEWAPVATFALAGDLTIPIAAKWFRVRRSDSKTPTGTPTCDVGANDDGVTLSSLVATAGDGSGASVNTSTLGPYKTVVVGGAFRGNVNIEISNDNVHFSPEVSFTNPGQKSATFITEFMRVTRDGVPTIAPGLPLITIAAGNVSSGGGGSGGGFQMFNVAAVAGQSAYAIVLPVARLNANYTAMGVVNSPAGNMWKGITIDLTSLTNVGFNAEMTAAAEAGDIMTFIVHDV